MSNLTTRPTPQPRNGVRALITQPAYQARFAEMLKERAPQFITSVTSQCASGPLAQVNPESVIAAAFTAATLDLPVDRNLGFAWIVPYKGMAQFQMGYRGYIQLAFRTGQYRRMNATTINAEALNGFDFVGEPIIDFTKLDDEKPAVGYALVFELVNGFRKTIYWSKQKVEKHAKRYSQSYGRGSNSPWTTNFDDMAIKTVIANGLKKWGILSVEMQKAFRHDQGAQIDIDSEVIFPDGKEIEQPKIEQGGVGGKNPMDDATGKAEQEPHPEPEPESGDPIELAAARHSTRQVEAMAAEETEPTQEEVAAAKPAKAAEVKGPSIAELQTTITNRLAEIGIGKVTFARVLVEQGYMQEKVAFDKIPAEVLQSAVDGWDDLKSALLPQ